MTKAIHTTSAMYLRQNDTLRSTLLLLLLCVTIVWPASLQSLFQSLDSDAFLVSHTALMEQAAAQDDSFAVAEYTWIPDPSDNQSALTKSSQIASNSALRPSDHNTRRVDNTTDTPSSTESSESDDATITPEIVSHAHHSSGTNVFFADCALPTYAAAHAADAQPSQCLQALARKPWQSPERLPSDRGLVRFSIAPPASC